jgi:segregation and condensation protein B
MEEKYKNVNRGITIREINSSYQLCTKPEYSIYIKKLSEPRQKHTLSQAAYETLAIVAYNEPVTKAVIDNIRGVNSDSPIQNLTERNLIQEAGRMEAPGRPILYKTTEEFLRSFGFNTLNDLPSIDNFSDTGNKNL